MMTSKVRWSIALVGIFLAGAAAGSVLSLGYVKRQMERRAPSEQFVARHLDRLAEELALTPDQLETVRAIVREHGRELRRLREESMVQTRARIREMNAQIATVLTPEQRVKFDEALERQRERMRRFQEERSLRGDGGGPKGEGAGPRPPRGEKGSSPPQPPASPDAPGS
jgi:Spy/CpxP family protein refolding chaperone